LCPLFPRPNVIEKNLNRRGFYETRVPSDAGGERATNPLQEMIPLLMDVQQNLDRDLDLQFLAGKYGYSQFHFQRLFSNAMGETPKEYVQRLR
jgi:transcriptional regulator GlxA family with amidase domain